MSDIAKKYVKALVSSVDEKELEQIHQALSGVVPAFKNRKFAAIVENSEISKAKKSGFLLDLLEYKSQKFENFIKLLVEKDRIDLIPSIVKELNYVIEERTKTYHGRLISANRVDPKAIAEIESALSGKLGVTVKLENVVAAYSGMKVEIENLGLEIGLSTDRIKQQIAQTILRAI